MERGAQPIFKIEPLFGEGCGHPAGVFSLNIIVVSLDNCFLAGEVVVGGAEGDLGSSGETAHGGGFKPTFAEDAERSGEDMGAGELGFGSGDGCIEHVQIIERSLGVVKTYLEHVRVCVQI